MYDDDHEGKEANIKTKICEVCGEEDEKLTACRMCGVNFCDECGYSEKYLCYDCGDEVDEGLEDEAEETLVESSEMDAEE